MTGGAPAPVPGRHSPVRTRSGLSVPGHQR